MIAEGPRVVFEAARGSLRIPRLVLTEDVPVPENLQADLVIHVSAKVFRGISATESPQGILALVEPPIHVPESIFGAVPLIVVLDGVQDPGNAGAVARAAEAFGATGLIFPKGAVSPHHPKTVRASAGSLFRIPFLRGLSLPAVHDLLRNRVSLLAAVPRQSGATPAWSYDLTRPVALLIGSEGQGLNDAFSRAAQKISIPTLGVESLNAAMAAGVLLYEASRQRNRP